MDLEELAEADVPLPLTAGLQVARAWLDQTLDGPGKFTGGDHPQLQRVARLDDVGLAGLANGNDDACLA